MREAHVSAQQPEAQQDARLPRPDADTRRPSGAQGATRAGPQAARGLTRSIRDRGTFAALARARPLRRGAVALRAVDGGGEGPAQVAYAVGRNLGNAVARNRARRRLRAAVQRHEAELRPGGAYLFSAARSAMTMSFEELDAAVAQLVRTNPGSRR